MSLLHLSIGLFLVLLAASLIARTYADVCMIKDSTTVKCFIIGRSATLFKDNLARLADAIILVKELSPEEVRSSSPLPEK